MPGPQIVRLEPLARPQRARQEPVAQRHRRQEAHPARRTPGQQRAQRLRRPHRQLGLDRAHREHLLHPLQLPHRPVVQPRPRPPAAPHVHRAQPQRPHLPGPHQVRHRAPCLLHGHLGVRAVQLVQVDDVRVQPPQRRVAGPPDVARAAVGHDVLLAGQQPHLGRHEGVRPPLLEHPADQQLVGERPVHVRRVQQRHTGVQRPVDRPQRLLAPPPRRGVRPAHRHAPEPHGPHLEPRRAQRPALHLAVSSPVPATNLTVAAYRSSHSLLA